MEENLSQERNTGKVQNKNKLSSTHISCQGFTNPGPPLNLLTWVASGSLRATESTFQLLSTFGSIDPKPAKQFVAILVLFVTN